MGGKYCSRGRLVRIQPKARTGNETANQQGGRANLARRSLNIEGLQIFACFPVCSADRLGHPSEVGGKVDEQGARDEGVQLQLPDTGQAQAEGSQQVKLPGEDCAEGIAQLWHLQGIPLGKVQGAVIIGKGFPRAIDVRQAVQTAGQRPAVIDQTTAVICEQGARRQVILGHVAPAVVGQPVEDVGRLKFGPHGLQFAGTPARFFQHLLPGAGIEPGKPGLQQPCIEQADFKEPPTAGRAAFMTDNLAGGVPDTGGKPAVNLQQKSTVLIKELPQPVIPPAEL